MLADDEREKSQEAQKDMDNLVLSIRKLRKLAGDHSSIDYHTLFPLLTVAYLHF